MKKVSVVIVFIIALVAASCSSSKNASASMYKRHAEASYYADMFNGRKTANGERFSNNDLTAAHRKLPFGTKVKVTNVANGESVIVKINDRGPQKKSREIDLSKRAFMSIADNKNHGTLTVNLEVIR
ncbi:septal ring lytic transglycosylase RlpA family protein [Flavobacterium silvaticum]|uniref:Probable endolytic peptidoglycan transglycosylase RlpA n=1 Tax=Flavobacterium silvaticum TaxID=1852020 RepID=A0A972FZF9_9FLAO|nr:septal ring lytic transglycosylase RlpA family protein [Flavobacterium silvaticum]NMH27621.1 septal ring lytic transglycosylase RlpA family protein [Flavobacterium silvaticum]